MKFKFKKPAWLIIDDTAKMVAEKLRDSPENWEERVSDRLRFGRTSLEVLMSTGSFGGIKLNWISRHTVLNAIQGWRQYRKTELIAAVQREEDRNRADIWQTLIQGPDATKGSTKGSTQAQVSSGQSMASDEIKRRLLQLQYEEARRSLGAMGIAQAAIHQQQAKYPSISPYDAQADPFSVLNRTQL